MRPSLVFGLLLVYLAVTRMSVSQTVPALPDPSGPFGIGRVSYDWTDANRRDPFSSNPDAHREVMVYVWYPAPSSSITLHARERAPLTPSPQRFPMVLFSHGNGVSQVTYTAALEEIVSHGYVVAAIEHPYSSAAVVFSDGRVIRESDRRTLLGNRPAGVPYFEGVEIAMRDMRQMTEIQAADVSFALDRLGQSASDKTSPLFGRLDFERTAAIGHSLGGMTAVRACQRDARIKACGNLDGGTSDGLFHRFPDAKPLAQPFLSVEATPPPAFTDQQLSDRGITRAQWTENVRAIEERQTSQLREGSGGSYRVVLRAPGMWHGSFGDDFLSPPDGTAYSQALHNFQLTSSVTVAFLDKVLKGAKSTLLDGTGTPEMRVEKFGRQP